MIDGQAINITVSIGISICPETVNDINMIFRNADHALYQAKTTDRGMAT